jgi:hypothetical protein
MLLGMGRIAEVVRACGDVGVGRGADSGEASSMSETRRGPVQMCVAAGGVYTVAGS